MKEYTEFNMIQALKVIILLLVVTILFVSMPFRVNAAVSFSSYNKRYTNLIFVGDSRTEGMSNAISGTQSKNVGFVYQWGQGYNWLSKDKIYINGTAVDGGYKKLINKVNRINKQNKKAKIAIVFNLGINDCSYAGNAYVKYYKSKASKLKKKNCDLYYMSINPVGRRYSFLTSDIKNLNSLLKKSLKSSGYTWIDSYSYFTKNNSLSFSDDIHYKNSSYVKIYEYCVKKLKK